ncbi:cold-shock protein [Rhizobium tumorigenes]|uniref:cold-shock protein n=1 Tax=Rhizobium tumorigenes TaxID=2041385 RepID=UPI000DA8B447
MATGKVKWFNVTKGYGFITPDDGSADVFLHLRKIEEAKLPPLEPGTSLEYTLGDKNGKVFAENLVMIAPPAPVAKVEAPVQQKRSPNPVVQEVDADAEFEREWGLRRF